MSLAERAAVQLAPSLAVQLAVRPSGCATGQPPSQPGCKIQIFSFPFYTLSPDYRFSQSSFSSVSKPIFAPKYAFFSIFRDLQDFHTFAPLSFAKSVLNIVQNFAKIAHFS